MFLVSLSLISLPQYSQASQLETTFLKLERNFDSHKSFPLVVESQPIHVIQQPVDLRYRFHRDSCPLKYYCRYFIGDLIKKSDNYGFIMSASNFYYVPRSSTWAKISDCISSIFLIFSSISFLLSRSDGGVGGGVGVGVGSLGVGSGGEGFFGTFNGDSGLEVITWGVCLSGDSGAFT